ncbi:MAG: methyl-accepting chemotaxis protein [Pseudomonadota bacterium]
MKIRALLNVNFLILGILAAAAGALGVHLIGTINSWLLGTMIIGGIFGVTLILTTIIARRIMRPIEELHRVVLIMRKEGDLSLRAPVYREDEIGMVSTAFNSLIVSFQGIMGQIIYNATEVSKAASYLNAESKQVASSSEKQRDAAMATASAVEELSVGISQVASGTAETAAIASTANELSTQGTKVAQEASAEITRIAEAVTESARVVSALSERSKAVTSIVNFITGIADQTNLLALNAAIEAARAGEQGRGFAVVADEIRKLAERTSTATSEISEMITAIQNETHSALSSIDAGSSKAQHGASLARRAAESLEQINRGARDTMEKISNIASATNEQSAASEEISRQLERITHMTEANNESAVRALSAANRVENMAGNLKEVGRVFRIGEAAESAFALHAKMPTIVQKAAADVARVLETAVKSGRISLQDLFDRDYKPIPNTNPQKHKTRFDDLTDQLLPSLQEPLLDQNVAIVYAGAVDDHGYFPTHNKRFSQPLTGDPKIDIANNRTKRIFEDVVGKRCGSHENPYLLQTYRRDTGEIMHDISAPIYVNGRHWGGFRIGYRTE